MVAPENLDLVVQVRVLTGQPRHSRGVLWFIITLPGSVVVMSNFKAIILAAGKGTRMKSEAPKVLHQICGRPMLEYVLDITKALRSLKTFVVVGHGAQEVREAVKGEVAFVVQEKLLGTADAVNRCAPHL